MRTTPYWPPRCRLVLAIACGFVPATEAIGQRASSAHLTICVAAASRSPRTASSSTPATNEWPGALTFVMKPGWHIYGIEPGTTGLPTRTSWKHADGWSVRSVRWPVPVRRVRGRDTTFEYEGTVVVPFTLRALRSRSSRGLHALTVSVGVCKDICIPETVTVQFQTSALRSSR
ncbi:MAG: protein-disulfide reductase DsbD domain-containing protein [Gemmatimonadota bacterium]